MFALQIANSTINISLIALFISPNCKKNCKYKLFCTRRRRGRGGGGETGRKYENRKVSGHGRLYFQWFLHKCLKNIRKYLVNRYFLLTGPTTRSKKHSWSSSKGRAALYYIILYFPTPIGRYLVLYIIFLYCVLYIISLRSVAATRMT